MRKIIRNIQFLIRNLWAARKLAVIDEVVIENYVITGCSFNRLKDFNEVYKIFHDGKSLDVSKLILYSMIGKRICFLVSDRSEIVAIELYYFNKRDIVEKTIHQGFTGVVPHYQRKGLSALIRRQAVMHYSKHKDILEGMSSRVSLTNIASLKSNQKVGFEVAEKYYDATMKEERYYLELKFEQKSTS